MKRVIILGNTISGLAAAEEIRRTDADCEILVFPFDGTQVFYPHLLPGLLAQEIKEKAARWREPAFYEKQRIVFSAQKISRINFNRRRVITEEKETLDCDYLFITDTGLLTKTDVKGDNKTGFYLWPRAEVIEQTSKTLPLVETAVVQGETFSCLTLVLALRRAGKEVLWVNARKDILNGLLDKESAEVVRRLLEESGVRLFNENSVVEILGDNDVKAIRLKSGKVIAAQMVFWGETRPDFRLFKETGLLYEEKISVDRTGRTNFPNVFALGTVAASSAGMDESFENSFEYWQKEGAQAGDCSRVEKEPGAPFSPKASFEIQKTPVRLLGRMAVNETGRMMKKHDETTGAFIKVSIQANRLQGAVLINAEEAFERLSRLFEQPSELSGIEEIFPRGPESTASGAGEKNEQDIAISSCVGDTQLSAALGEDRQAASAVSTVAQEKAA